MPFQEANWNVVNCSTPANYSHVLIRQLHRDFRKPLILVTPKNLLREKKCTSTLADMGEHTKFKRVYRETDPQIANSPDKVRRIIYCPGQIYYELVDEREKRGIKDIAIIRIEQLAPFPWDKVAEEAAYYKNAETLWCQEEPKNMGAWSFVQPRICKFFSFLLVFLVPYVLKSPLIIVITPSTGNAEHQWRGEETPARG